MTKLDLTQNPVLEKLKDNNNNTDEKVALLKILSRFKRIDSIETKEGSRYCSIKSYGPQIEYALRTAHAGRILVEGNNVDHYSQGDDNKTVCDNNEDENTKGYEGDGGGEKNRQGKHSSKDTLNKSIVPLSVWPKLLERSYKHCIGGDNKKDATGLYYLVRNGPIIGAIASQRGHLHVVEEKYDDDSKEESEEDKRCKKKRKRTSWSSSSRHQRRPNHVR